MAVPNTHAIGAQLLGPKRTVPVALSIAGSDSSGGAGIQADHKTFAALGVYGASVLTALTAQNTTGVQGVHAVPADFVRAQIESVLSDLDVRAIKTGMLATAEIIHAVAGCLAAHPDIPAVVDPVMVATSGDLLIEPDAVAAVRQTLLPRASILTPNLNEAAELTGMPVATSRDDMAGQAQALQALGAHAVLIKGGHFGTDATADDYFLDANGDGHWISAPRIDTGNLHGTGCTLSSAIAASLVRGDTPREAVANAKAYLTAALEAGRDQVVGAGAGPVDHLHAVRRMAVEALER